MQYEGDFAGAASTTPIDGLVVVGAEPIFWLLILAMLVLGVLAGRAWGAGGREGDDVDDIWTAVDDKVKAAMKADAHALPAKAEALSRTLQARLGRSLKLGGASKPLAALDKALKGEGDDGHGHGHGHKAGNGDHEDKGHGDAAHHAEHGSTPSSVAVTNPVTVIVNGAPPKDDHSGHDDHGPKTLSVKEREHALRLAVSDFNEHWRHRQTRTEEMRAALAELSGR